LPLLLDDDDEGAAEAPVALPAAGLAELEVVEPEALAAAWNAAKVLFTLGLIAKTIPDWQ
jgi:hypothetical protein